MVAIISFLFFVVGVGFTLFLAFQEAMNSNKFAYTFFLTCGYGLASSVIVTLTSFLVLSNV